MKNKHLLSSLPDNYFKSSTQIFKAGLDATTIAVYCFMVSCAEGFNPSIKYMSERLKLKRATVANCIAQLIERNVIRAAGSTRKGFATVYEFIDPKEWKIEEFTDGHKK